jgi:WD40 repeat protein
MFAYDPNDITITTLKGRFMKIMKRNNTYLLDPNKYDISKLMMELDITKLNKLEAAFKEKNNEITKNDFIKMMMEELKNEYDNNKLNLVYGLYKLFNEIDFNGDGKMQWEEFTQFIIDKVMGENDNDTEDVMADSKDNNEKNLVKYKRYNISPIEDKWVHDNDIIDAVFLPKIDRLLAVEFKSKDLLIYNPKKGKAFKYDLEKKLREMEEKKMKRNIHLDNKKNKAIKNTLSFSILSMYAIPQYNLVAICTTSKKIIFIEFNSEMDKEEVKFEMTTSVLQKKIWYLPEHNVWLSTGSKRDEESSQYCYLYELDVEFEYRNFKLEVFSNVGLRPDVKFYRKQIPNHTDEILDVTEIRKPQLIVTACMDKMIRLINLNDFTKIKRWRKHHTSSVRCLDYNPYLGAGLILSVGFEYYINLWSTDVSIKEKASFKGKLEGHYSPVIMCKFICNSPMCVSIDEEGNVRIWDTRQFLCLQLITQTNINFKGHKILIMPKYNKFIFYGNKILFYDTKYQDTEVKVKNVKEEENYPIKVEFNKYYMNFYVATHKDVRIYSSKNGELTKVFKSLRSNNVDTDTKIKYFTFENRGRKFYLGFSSGAVQQFNAGNGSLIKKIGENEEEHEGITTIKYDHHNSEITHVHFNIDENNDQNNQNIMLLTTALDSIINIYDESDPEETDKKRVLRGGHKIEGKVNQILCMSFSKHLNLFATGSTDGLITVWDYELSKIDDICYFKKEQNQRIKDVYTLKFLDPYPVLVASYSDGSVYFWGIKHSKHKYECFFRMKNYNFNSTRFESSPVTAMVYIEKEMEEIAKDMPKHSMKIKRARPKIDASKINMNTLLGMGGESTP